MDVLGVGDFYYELAVIILPYLFVDTNSEHMHSPEEKERGLP